MKLRTKIDKKFLDYYLILEELRKFNKRFDFISLYINKQFYKTYDLINITLWEEFAFEWYMGSEVSNLESKDGIIAVTLTDSNLFEFKIEDIFYMSNEEVLSNISNKINDYDIKPKGILTEVILTDRILNITTVLSSNKIFDNDENFESKIREFTTQAYKADGYNVKLMPVQLMDNRDMSIIRFSNYDKYLYRISI